MINSIDSWQVVDECPGTSLDTVFPISKRTACLIARNKTKSVLKTNFLNIQGAVEMMKGLDYHHDNFMNVINSLAQIGLTDEANEFRCILLHEAVAYLNRLGQYYYFLRSDFVRKNCAAAESFAPTIVAFVVFRRKHSAHRSIDAPKGESAHVQTTQAMSMSSVWGQMFEPKPGHPCHLSQVKTQGGIEEFSRNQWKNSYLVFQLITDNPNDWHNFSIEKEHPIIMEEAFTVLEKVLN